MNKLYRNIAFLVEQIKNALVSFYRRSTDKSEGYEPTTGLLVDLLEAIGDYSTDEIKFRFSYCGKRKTFSVHVRDKDDIPSMFVLDSSSRIEITQHNIEKAIYWIWSKRLEILELELGKALKSSTLSNPAIRGRKVDVVIFDDTYTTEK